MPRFFIDTTAGDYLFRDTEGLEVTDFDAARRLADALPDMAREQLPNGPEKTFRAVVPDEAGAEVYSAELRLCC